MAIRPILQLMKSGGSIYDQSILTSPAKRIDRFDESLQEIVQHLMDTMNAHEICVGLAAPQIGIDRSVAVARVSQDEVLVMVNPKITAATGKKDLKRESCMSLWGWQGAVQRREKVAISYQSIEGVECERVFAGYPARIIQHEIDHLDGRLYESHVSGDLEPTDIFEGRSPDGATKPTGSD